MGETAILMGVEGFLVSPDLDTPHPQARLLLTWASGMGDLYLLSALPIRNEKGPSLEGLMQKIGFALDYKHWPSTVFFKTDKESTPWSVRGLPALKSSGFTVILVGNMFTSLEKKLLKEANIGWIALPEWDPTIPYFDVLRSRLEGTPTPEVKKTEVKKPAIKRVEKKAAGTSEDLMKTSRGNRGRREFREGQSEAARVELADQDDPFDASHHNVGVGWDGKLD